MSTSMAKHMKAGPGRGHKRSRGLPEQELTELDQEVDAAFDSLAGVSPEQLSMQLKALHQWCRSAYNMIRWIITEDSRLEARQHPDMVSSMREAQHRLDESFRE